MHTPAWKRRPVRISQLRHIRGISGLRRGFAPGSSVPCARGRSAGTHLHAISAERFGPIQRRIGVGQ